MDFLSSRQYAVVNLTTGKISEERLDDNLLRETLGGVGVSLELYRQYEDQDPIILGTGLLTGTLAPASCLGFVTAKSPRSGRVVHAPLTLFNGVELKLSGFDYVVIVGASTSPTYLWLHDELIDLRDGSGLWGTDVWNTVDQIRHMIGEDQVQVITIGKAGEQQSKLAQLSLNHWSSGDRFGLGAVFGMKKLKAVAVRGLGSLEVDDANGFIDEAVSALEEIRDLPVAGLRGLGDLSSTFADQQYGQWVEPLVHRHRSCFNCPAACNTFLKYHESPQVLSYKGIAEPGVLITDFEGMLGLRRAGFEVGEAAKLSEECSRLGIDVLGVAYAASSGTKIAAGSLEELISADAKDYAPWPWEGETANSANQGPFSTWSVPDRLVGTNQLSPSVWMRNNGIGYALGICPLFLALTPEVNSERLVSLLNLGTGWDVTSQELEQVIARTSSDS